MSKHTPGPWTVHEEHTGSPEHSTWWRIDSSARFHMAKLEVFDVTAKYAHSEEHARNIMSEYYEMMSEVRANAALIAAAPDLLAALKAKVAAEAQLVAVDKRWRDEITGLVPEQNKGSWEREYVVATLAVVDADDMVRAAIDKAEGK